MKEKTKIIPDKVNGATIPKNGTTIPIKFNKEIRNLTVDEVTLLSQKGLKYEAIEKQWERIKAFSKEEKLSTSEFLDALEKRRTEKRIEELTKECGGNSEMAKRIAVLEGHMETTLPGEKDFKEFFPEKAIEELPEEVLNRTEEGNSNLLNEYLRFKAREYIETQKQEQQLLENAISSVGSQKDCGAFRTPESEQFIRGLWNN